MEPKQPEDRDHEQANGSVGSTEYRTKLLTKLNCLMAVLEVAISKIDRSLELPAANQDRLTRIRANLENTLAICTRAKDTLEKAMNTGHAPQEQKALPGPSRKTADRQTKNESMSYRDYVELSTIEEYKKFKSLPPIAADELASTDVDELIRKLAGA